MGPDRRARPSGVTLVEVMIALAILGVVLVSLAGLMVQMGRYTRVSGNVTWRSAALESASSWGQSLPWDSIPALVGCVADSVGQLAYTRCMTYTSPGAGVRRLRIVIDPATALGVGPDTLVVNRSQPRLPSPLYVAP